MFAQLFAVLALSASALALPTGRALASTAQCSAVTQTELDNLTCPALVNAASFTYFQSDNLNTETDTILGAVVDLIKSTVPNADVATIISAATEGLTGNLVIGVTELLYTAADTLEDLNPDCRCNTLACYDALDNAAGDGSAGTTNTQASCAEAKYACAPFYTSAQVNQMIPACAQFTGATNA